MSYRKKTTHLTQMQASWLPNSRRLIALTALIAHFYLAKRWK
jgi:hypothetical protein